MPSVRVDGPPPLRPNHHQQHDEHHEDPGEHGPHDGDRAPVHAAALPHARRPVPKPIQHTRPRLGVRLAPIRWSTSRPRLTEAFPW